MRLLVKAIESNPLTAGHVNFTDQQINRRLALIGSREMNSWVTLDMKEASDRVSLQLVEDLFPATWVRALTAARTTATKLPDGTVVQLKKFAPMGSAVCFPVEALVFWALSVCAVRMQNPTLTSRDVRDRIYVYGDDLIVRSEDQAAIRQLLPEFGLLFNEGKCCVAGSFRESCGCDAFKGVEVTPLRIKSTWVDHLPGASYASWVAVVNGFLQRGMWLTADLILRRIQLVRRTPYTDEVNGSSYVAVYDIRKTARHENNLMRFRKRFNVSLSRWEIYAWQVRSRRITSTGASSWAEMQRIASLKTRETSSSSLAPLRRLVQAHGNEQLLSYANNCKPLTVTAYQYTLPRQVTLRRGWAELR
jgi:hypothetical protein